MKYDPHDPAHKTPPAGRLGLYPRGGNAPNVIKARRAKRIGHRYITISQGLPQAHRDPICTRSGAHSQVVSTPMFQYEDGRLVAFRGVDDPVFVTECRHCADTPIIERKDTDWRKQASCNVPGLDLSGYFINPGRDMDFAAQLCAECPVQLQCADYGAKVKPEQPNRATVIWGGEKTMKGQDNERV